MQHNTENKEEIDYKYELKRAVVNDEISDSDAFYDIFEFITQEQAKEVLMKYGLV